MLLSENEILYAIAPCTLGFPIKHISKKVCNHGLMNLVVTLVCCHASCHAKKHNICHLFMLSEWREKNKI